MRSQRMKSQRVRRKLRRVMQLPQGALESALQELFYVDYMRCAPVCLYACVTHIHFHIHTKEAYLLHFYWHSYEEKLQQQQRRQQLKKEEQLQRSQRKVDFFKVGGWGWLHTYTHACIGLHTYTHTYLQTYAHIHKEAHLSPIQLGNPPPHPPPQHAPLELTNNSPSGKQ